MPTLLCLPHAEAHGSSYLAGSDIDFHVLINAHHWGRWQFRVCPIDFVDATKDCILMKRYAVIAAVCHN